MQGRTLTFQSMPCLNPLTALKMCSSLKLIRLLSSLPVQIPQICASLLINILPLRFAHSAHIQKMIYYVLNYLKRDETSWGGKPISLDQLPLSSHLIFHLIPFHHDRPPRSIIKVASSISSFYPMGAQWHYVGLTFSNEGNIAHDSSPSFFFSPLPPRQAGSSSFRKGGGRAVTRKREAARWHSQVRKQPQTKKEGELRLRSTKTGWR